MSSTFRLPTQPRSPPDVTNGTVPGTIPVMTATDQPTFTFIDHDDDLSSKRIKNANARRAIRSHVMRDVRRRERLAGMKRVSRRDGRMEQGDVAYVQTGDLHHQNTSSARIMSLDRATPSSVSSSPKEAESRGDSQAPCESRSKTTSSSSTSPESLVNSGLALSLLDPFITLPGAKESTDMLNQLVYYCEGPIPIRCSSICSSMTR